jgi:hypothetical protein
MERNRALRRKERMNLREGQNKDEESSSIKEILNEI